MAPFFQVRLRAAASLTKLGQVKRFREKIEHFSDESKTAMSPWLSKLLIDKHRKLNDFLKRAQFHQFPNLEIVPSFPSFLDFWGSPPLGCPEF